MKIQICIAALIAICVTPAAKADHKHGGGNECWRDSKYPGSGWAYYYCGAQSARCDGKKSKGHDTVFWQSHGEGFTFQTEPHETYFCCGGNGEKSGMYVRSDTWIVNTETERMSVAGGTCNKQIKTDACGGTHVVECTEPDTCNTGLILRNKECIKPCNADEVFADAASNTCIKCERTVYQGPAEDQNSCIQCDQYTEFFNRQTKKCIKKSTLKQYAKDTMKECWRCPSSVYNDCVKEMNKPSDQRGFAITNWKDIKKQCHLK